MDEAAFLSAIAPTEDNTARLVFADWLDERDDFRAEFVRAAVAYDLAPPYDIERVRLGERLDELLASEAFRKWLSPDEALKWSWRRGLLAVVADTARLQVRDPARGADQLASLWVERAEFDGYTSGSQPDWDDTFGRARNARELYFGTDDYGPDVLARLREWPHLRALNISYLMEPWSDLAALPHLRALTLRNPDWTMMPELHAARLPELEVLDVDKEWNDDLPIWAECFPKLRALTLGQYNAYPDEQCARFAECPHLRHLALHQRYQPFTRAGLKALARAKGLRSLGIGLWPRGTVEPLAELPELVRLQASGKNKRVRGLEALTGLRWLSLATGVLAKSLTTQARDLPHLARLDVWCDSLETGALAALARASELRILVVRTGDGPPPLSELVRLEGVRHLRIGHPGLPPGDLTALRAALPDCRIVNGSWPRRENEYDWG